MAVQRLEFTVQTSLVVHDNTSNLTKALNDAKLLNVSCFDHTREVCIVLVMQSKDKKMQFLSHMLARCHAVMTHFWSLRSS